VVIAGLAWLLVANQFGLSVFQQQKSSLLLQVGAANGNTLGNGQNRRLSLPKYAVFCCAAILAVQVALDLYVSGAIKPGHSFGFMAGLASVALLLFPRLQAEHDA
jgi:hypothetical protein